MAKNPARLHISFGWAWITCSFLVGVILGMFVFNGPIQLGPEMMDYTSLPRRLLRLSHISFVGLGFLNILYGLCINYEKGICSKVISFLLIAGTLMMSTFLIASAFFEPLKYLMSIPATFLTLALFLISLKFLKR